MQYWAFTKDESYSNVMMDGLVSQLGSKYDFILPQEKFDTGNDDQAFWVFAAMSAAEYGFPPPPSPAPAWHQIVTNAWEDFARRWVVDSATCGGGLNWQFTAGHAGTAYKNSISNGAFFQISARLARFTGNNTYMDWAEKIWDWTEGVGLISSTYDVYDGTDANIKCSAVDHHQWTYNVGVFLYGTAILSNYTNLTQIWIDRTTGLMSATDSFFSPFPNATDIMFEAACELASTCNVDQWSMKAYLARTLASSSVVAPYIAGKVGRLLRASASGASTACTSGYYGNTCGSKWFLGFFDGIAGLGQQLSAFDVVTGLLANDSAALQHQTQVTISYPTAFPTTIVETSTPGSTAPPLHDPPPNGVSKRGTVKYGGLLLGLAHALL